MIKSKATTAIILETRVTKKDGTHPVKLRVTFNRKQKYYTTGHSFTESDFERVISDKPRGEFKDYKFEILEVEKKAIAAIDELPEFTFEKFEKLISTRKEDRDNVFFAFDEAIKKLYLEDRPGTASNYQCSANSLKKYTGKDVLPFEAITIDFLKNYEKWMLKEGSTITRGKEIIIRGSSLTTIGIYLRNVRSLFNDAISAGLVKRELYPFNKRGYQIPSGRNIKKALDLTDIEKIFEYKTTEGSTEDFAKDLWLFSYLCNGMNIKDIARLKFKNIDGDKINFIRAKTERTTKKDLKQISVYYSDEAKQIVSKWGNKSQSPEEYIFPILSKGLTSIEERKKVQQITKTVNKYISRIAESLKISKHITTYTARHSFSTVLKRSGAPIEFISESLGHQDLKTTESYLDSFEDSFKKEWASKLTSFKTVAQ